MALAQPGPWKEWETRFQAQHEYDFLGPTWNQLQPQIRQSLFLQGGLDAGSWNLAWLRQLHAVLPLDR